MGLDWKQIVPERYRIVYEQKTGVWRILDMWHPAVMNIADIDIEIPDDSPAVKLLSDMEINALIAKLDEMGWLDKIVEHKIQMVSLKKKVSRGKLKEDVPVALVINRT